MFCFCPSGVAHVVPHKQRVLGHPVTTTGGCLTIASMTMRMATDTTVIRPQLSVVTHWFTGATTTNSKQCTEQLCVVVCPSVVFCPSVLQNCTELAIVNCLALHYFAFLIIKQHPNNLHHCLYASHSSWLFGH